MKEFRINNGVSHTTVKEAIETVGMDVIAMMMDDEIREQVANEIAPCTDEEFVTEYLCRANEDLIIG